MKSRLTLLAVLLLAGCTHAGEADPRIGVTPRNQIVPLVDAHQHMMSPTVMELTVRQPSPPPVRVPAELAELLSAREKRIDQASYAALFDPDAMVFAEEQGRWWRGSAHPRRSR